MTEATVAVATTTSQGACPPWCTTPGGCDARTAPHPDDRRHHSWTVVVPLSLEPPAHDMRVGPVGLEVYLTSDPQELCARLDQHRGDAEPAVRVFTGEGAAACYSASVTLAEAEDLARGILALIEEARRTR